MLANLLLVYPGKPCDGFVPKLSKWEGYGLSNQSFYKSLLTVYSNATLSEGGFVGSVCRSKQWLIDNDKDCPITDCVSSKRGVSKRTNLFDILENLIKEKRGGRSVNSQKKLSSRSHNLRATCLNTDCADCPDPDFVDSACAGRDLSGRSVCCTCAVHPIGNLQFI
eukprot:TRINITY_DN8291_c0_g1_i1.p2 TRINITY_DN8291_c0_g1~~TRINITY_DN8291_c0_g1_i1.p2  ORF type:complete len:166 (-),score=22.11 TRINITY_DN8291_c0_g1_i1:22-519(-)